MIILTKKYRLIWNPNTGKAIGEPYYEHLNSETVVGKGMESFETDSIDELDSKIDELNDFLIFDVNLEL